MTTLGILLATGLVCILNLPAAIHTAAPPICFNCTRLPDGVGCKDFNSPCAAGQKCYHEVVETDSGDALHSWGCASSQLCKLEQSLSPSRKRLSIQRCFECCTDNFCNFGTCQKDYCTKVTCRNGASCRNTALRHVCDCPTGYTGQLCETDINECASSPCQNAGTCTEFVGRYTCRCPPGYTGINCEIDIDECASSPCKNGATCTEGVNQFTCTCPPGYTGTLCEINVDECASSPCQFSGTCTDLIDGYRCDCIPGITGVNCEINIDECANVTCLNGGVCNDHVGYSECTCTLGFNGMFCETSTGRVCYNCSGVDDATRCQNEVVCAQNEECYMEHDVSFSGAFSFNMGCVPSTLCSFLQNKGATGRRASNIQLCYECCDVNGCNHHACADSRGG